MIREGCLGEFRDLFRKELMIELVLENQMSCNRGFSTSHYWYFGLNKPLSLQAFLGIAECSVIYLVFIYYMPRVPPSYNQQNVSTYFQTAVRSTVTRQAENQCSGTSPLTLYYRSQCHGHHLEACYKYTAPSPTSELMNPNLHLTRSLANVNAH